MLRAYLNELLKIGSVALCLTICTHIQYVYALDHDVLGEECYDLLHSEDEVEPEAKEACLKRWRDITRSREATNLLVTPLRRPEDISEVAAAVSIVSKTELERSTANSIAEALRDVPGISVTDSGQAGLKRIRLRGEEARRVRILIDGQEFSDQREVGTPLLFSTEMIERIEIVRGTGSVVHGSRAIGGVINIITKKEGYHPLQATVSSSFDTATEGYQTFASAYGNIKGIGYRIAGTFAEHADRDTPAGDLENTSFDSNSLNAYLSKEWDSHRLAFSFDNYKSDSEVYVDPAVRTTPPFTDFRIDAPQRDRRKWAVFYDGEELTELVRSVHLDAYYQDSERDFNTFTDLALDFGGMIVPSSTSILTGSELDTIGGNGLIDLALGEDNILLVGFEAKTDDLEQKRNRQVTTAGRAGEPELTIEEASQTSLELFAEDVWNFAQNWALRGGARGVWVETKLDKTTRAGLPTDSTSDSHVLGAVGIKYSGIDNVLIWTGWSQGFVYPTMVNLATGAFAGPNYVNSNQDLDPETSNSVDLGMRYFEDSLTAELSFFSTWADDYIDHILCTGTGLTCLGISDDRDRVYDNIDQAQTFGAEFSGEVTVEQFTPYVNLAWLRRRFENAGAASYDTGLPALSGRGGVRVQHAFDATSEGWADVYFRAASDADELGRRGTEHHPGWATLNLSLGLTLGKRAQYRVVADLLNLTDKEYTPATENLLARGRSAIVRVAIDL